MGSSSNYSEFTSPIRNGGAASFDVHIYFDRHNDHEVKAMKAMRQAIKDEFPELSIYPIHDKPVGPHPLPMFEVDLFTPAQFGAFIPWLAINHGPLSVLIHPNTGKSRLDHTQNAIWIGNRLDLKLDTFDKEEEMDEVARRLEDVLGKNTS
ncbi:MAG: hypothetical protein L6R42_001486 [Xanthoria sp. 1 TBL-2021]|nr:MAG: hypothetical protein L6R42_001486 [Xanthoria sp. 1 TBL-2021]